jgi:nitrous oxide reductase accessory protein NosL
MMPACCIRMLPYFAERRAMLTRLALISGLSAALAGCAKEPEPAPVAPVKIEVVGHDFCDILRRINGPRGHLEWSVSDSPLSITRMRRVNAAYDARCSASSRPASAPRPSNPPTS